MDDREKREDEQLFSATAQLKKKKHKEGKPGSRRWLSLLALVVIVGLAVGVYYLSGVIVPPTPEATPNPLLANTSKLLIEKEKADLASAQIITGTDNYTVEQTDGVFAIKGMPLFSLDQTKAGNLATSCTYLYVTPIADKAENLQDYGLDKPLAKVTAAYRDGASKTMLLGAKAPTGYSYYMMLEGGQEIYTVYSSTGERFTATLQSLHKMPTLTVDSQAIQDVVLRRGDGQTVEVGYSDIKSLGISSMWLKQPFVYEADGEDVTALFEGIAAIKLKSYEADALDTTLSLYGLDQPRYELTVTGKGKSAEGADVTDAVLMTLWIGNDKNADTTYARIDGTNKIFLLDRASLDFLSGITAAQMVDRFANIINIQKVDGIEVSGSGVDAKFAISRTPELDESGNQKLNAGGAPTFIEDFTFNGNFIEDTTFRKLYQIIIGTRVDGMIPEGKVPGPEVAPELTVRYRLNEVREEETIEYLPYNADYYAVRRNGICMFYILKSRVNQIPSAIRDVEAGSFDPKKYGV